MAHSIELREIQADREVARAMRKYTLQDLMAMGMPKDEALRIANPDSYRSIRSQMNLITGDTGKFRMGVHLDGTQAIPDGFYVTQVPWPVSEEVKYMAEEPSENEMLRLTEEFASTVAIYSLVANRDLPPELQHLARERLMADIVKRADETGAAIRGSFYEGEPAAEIYWQHGFEIVPERRGRPLGSVVQRIVARPAK